MSAPFSHRPRVLALAVLLLPSGIAHAQHASHTLPPTEHSHDGHADEAPARTSTNLPVPTAAERAAAFPEVAAHRMQDDGLGYYVLVDRLDAWDADTGSGLHWSGHAWIGTDTRRLWLRSEGQRVAGRTEAADLELFYGRSLSPWWELLVGVRHDVAPGDARTWAAFGVAGLAPQKLDVAATAYVGPSGRTAARVDVDYTLLLSARWVLQPRLQADFHGDTDVARGLGSGLATTEGGVWLRYEVTRRFAPYVGLVRERAFGETAHLRRAQGEDTDEWRVVAGARFWF